MGKTPPGTQTASGSGKMNRTINEFSASFAKREGVEALVLAGSAVTGFADEESDYDLYAYTREAVPVEFRAKLLKPRAARLELHNTFWEWSDEWVEPDGTCFDLMYRSCDAFEADVEARLGRGLASLGYSTSLCYTVLHATPVFDRRVGFKPSRIESASTTGPRLGWPATSTFCLPPTGASTRARSAC